MLNYVKNQTGVNKKHTLLFMDVSTEIFMFFNLLAFLWILSSCSRSIVFYHYAEEAAAKNFCFIAALGKTHSVSNLARGLM